MSTTLSQTDEIALADVLREFGEIAGSPQIDNEALAAATLTAHVRGLLVEATHDDNVTVTELARRLNVSKSAVSRYMRRDGDMKLSTMALFARALGRKFVVDLHKDASLPQAGSNFYKIVKVVPEPGNPKSARQFIDVVSQT